MVAWLPRVSNAVRRRSADPTPSLADRPEQAVVGRGGVGLLWWAMPRVLAGVFVGVGAYGAWLLLTSPRFAGGLGFDFGIYRDAAGRWLTNGQFYTPSQILGPYAATEGAVLYPPVALLLFLPFTVLPGVLWWAIPLAITAWRVVALRPSAWGWLAITALACWPYDVEFVFTGNPTIWIVAIVALATRWSWMSAFVLLKPSLVPFALAGARTFKWWLALAVFGLVSLVFLPMWADWIRVVLNARGPFSGPLYSLKDLPIMLLPIAAWVTRSRELAAQGSDQPR